MVLRSYRCRLCSERVVAFIPSVFVPVQLLSSCTPFPISRAYLAETSMDHLADALKKGGIKDRTGSVLDAHFRSQVVDWWTRKQNAVIEEDIAKAIKESLEHEDQHERR